MNVPETEERSPDSPAPKLLVVAGASRQRQRASLALIPLAKIRPNLQQPRKHFDEERIAELAASIRDRGVIQPIVLRAVADDEFEILAGERRYRASKEAGLTVIPALVRKADDPLEIALIENLQREDLTPLEEAEALQGLADQHGYSHRELAELLGKSRPYISNVLSLLRLPDQIKHEIHTEGLHVSRELLMGVARSENSTEAEALWNRLKLGLMSVRRFREERSGQVTKPRTAAREVILAARRLNRGLKKLDETGQSVDPEERNSVLRTLRRSLRLIEKQIDALG